MGCVLLILSLAIECYLDLIKVCLDELELILLINQILDKANFTTLGDWIKFKFGLASSLLCYEVLIEY